MSATLLLLVVTFGTTPEDVVTYRGPGFTLDYPEKNVKLDPASARVPFQLEYRKNSLVRLETERLTQPINLEDPSFAQIFLEVQLERLQERVSSSQLSRTVRKYPWGTGIEFVYDAAARSGKRNERDRVTEVVTTVDETLFRFTTWIPEKDLARVTPVFTDLVASFRPERTVAATASPGVLASGGRFSLSSLQEKLTEYRSKLSGLPTEGPQNESAAKDQAVLARTLGLKAYLFGATPAELRELEEAAAAAARLAAGDPDSLRAQAWSAYHRRETAEMEEAIRKTLTVAPNDAETHLLYALWYSFNPERSEAMAREAIENDPDLAPAYYVKALADRREGDLTEARTALEKSLALDPGFAKARRELAEVLDEMGETNAALAAYRSLTLAAPEDVTLHFRLAVVARRAGLVDEAIEQYQAALGLDPDLAEAHYNLAVLYLQEKSSKALAAQSFQRFLELDPGSDRAATVRKWLRDNGY